MSHLKEITFEKRYKFVNSYLAVGKRHFPHSPKHFLGERGWVVLGVDACDGLAQSFMQCCWEHSLALLFTARGGGRGV